MKNIKFDVFHFLESAVQVAVQSVANTSYALGITDVTEDVQMAMIKPDGVRANRI